MEATRIFFSLNVLSPSNTIQLSAVVSSGCTEQFWFYPPNPFGPTFIHFLNTFFSMFSGSRFMRPKPTGKSLVPSIDIRGSPNVSVSVGRTAHLKCKTVNLIKKSVSFFFLYITLNKGKYYVLEKFSYFTFIDFRKYWS